MNPSILITPNAVKAGKLYSVIPTNGAGDLDVVRATSATYVGSDGLIKTALANVPRLDYTNANCPSILVEPQRTNLLSRSEEFENAYWIKNNTSIIPNATISPSGLMNADKLVENNLLSEHNIQVFIGGTELRTNSIFVKAGERSRFILWAGASGCMFDLINLTTTPGNNASGITSTLIEDYGNGWYRCSIVSTLGRSNGYRITLMDNLTNPVAISPSYQGDGVSGLYIWGAQREDAANVTSYIPTTTTSVTRNADVISKSGISSLIGQTEGTIYIEVYNTPIQENFKSLIVLYQGINITDNYISFGTGNGNDAMRLSVTINGVNVTTSTFTLPNNKLNKICITYTSSTAKVFLNGVQIGGTLSVTGPYTLDKLDLGCRGGARQWGAPIYDTFISKTALSDAEAIQLTTL